MSIPWVYAAPDDPRRAFPDRRARARLEVAARTPFFAGWPGPAPFPPATTAFHASAGHVRP